MRGLLKVQNGPVQRKLEFVDQEDWTETTEDARVSNIYSELWEYQ